MARKGRPTEEVIAALREAEVWLRQGETGLQVSNNIGADVIGKLRRLDRVETAQGEI